MPEVDVNTWYLGTTSGQLRRRKNGALAPKRHQSTCNFDFLGSGLGGRGFNPPSAIVSLRTLQAPISRFLSINLDMRALMIDRPA
jgi:hypothetical protein